MAGHMINPCAKFEAPAAICSWVMSSDTNTRNMTLRLEVTIGQQVCHQPIGRRPTRQTLCTFVVTLTLDHSLSDISRFLYRKCPFCKYPIVFHPKIWRCSLELYQWAMQYSEPGLGLIMVAICNRAEHYIFALWFLLSFFLLFFLA